MCPACCFEYIIADILVIAGICKEFGGNKLGNPIHIHVLFQTHAGSNKIVKVICIFPERLSLYFRNKKNKRSRPSKACIFLISGSSFVESIMAESQTLEVPNSKFGKWGRLYCIACKAYSGKLDSSGNEIKLYCFPSGKSVEQKQRCRAWVQKVKTVRSDPFTVNKNTRLCSQHFVNIDPKSRTSVPDYMVLSRSPPVPPVSRKAPSRRGHYSSNGKHMIIHALHTFVFLCLTANLTKLQIMFLVKSLQT